MRLRHGWNTLTKKQRETVRYLDQKYYDSDPEDVEEMHLRFREKNQQVVYFVENRALKGYAVIRLLNDCTWYIIWFVAPKCGAACLKILLQMKSFRGKEVRLYVSCFPEKAYEARLRLFKQAGFMESKIKVSSSGISMRRPCGASLDENPLSV